MGNILKDKLSEFDAVIFDMDGTLLDSMSMWHQIDIDYLGKFGLEVPKHLQKDIEGFGFTETAIYFKNRFHLPDTIEQIKADWNQMAFDMYCNHIPLKAGAMEFLQWLKRNHYKLGIATSNSHELVQCAFQALKINQFFDCVVTSCDVNKGKPSPDIYLKVASKLNVVPSSCLVFEDILPGIMAGKAAGMKVCAVEDVYSADIKDKKIDSADYFIENYFELI